MSSDVMMVYLTAPSEQEARRIGLALVEERLAACVNLRPHDAIYLWEARVATGSEYALIAKTTRDVLPRPQARMLDLHTHAVPCIVAVPVADGYAPFLEWIAREVG